MFLVGIYIIHKPLYYCCLVQIKCFLLLIFGCPRYTDCVVRRPICSVDNVYYQQRSSVLHGIFLPIRKVSAGSYTYHHVKFPFFCKFYWFSRPLTSKSDSRLMLFYVFYRWSSRVKLLTEEEKKWKPDRWEWLFLGRGPCSLVETDLRGACCHHHRSDDFSLKTWREETTGT
jgi:hypothetical protein